MLEFWVSFNSKNNTFYPNSQITATVYLENDREISARKIEIRIKGIVKTSWNEIRHLGQVTEYIPYGSELHYINAYAILWQSMDVTNQLQPGKYQFPFQFTIPQNAPPSMVGDLGSVRYFVRTNIDIPKSPDEIRIFPFFVCSFLNLNYDRQLSIGIYSTATEIESGCFSCSSYPLSVKVGIPKTGYAPAEIIQVSVKITNKTSWKVTRFEIGILQNFIYTGKCNYQSDYGRWRGPPVMDKKTSNVITIKNVDVYRGLNANDIYTLKVPQLISTYRGDSLIANTYSLFVKTFTDSVFSSGPIVKLPITIGNISLNDSSSSAAATVSTSKSRKNKSGCIKITEEKQNSEVTIPPKIQDRKSSNSNIKE